MNIQEQLTILGINGKVYKAGKEILVSCPLHEDKSPSCSVNLEDGRWICYAGCGGGDWIDFVERVRRDPEYAPIESIVKAVYNNTPVLESLLKRGFNRDILSRWGIEWDSQKNAMSMPLWDRVGKLISTMWRFPQGVQPKYRYELGFKRSEALYGLWKLPTKVTQIVLVEGPLDAIWVQEAGISALAILGSSLSEQQVGIIKGLHATRIILCFDNDAAGRHADHEAIKLLRQHGCWVYRVVLPAKFNDIQEVASGNVAKMLASPQLAVNGSGILHARYRRWQEVKPLKLVNNIWKS